MKKFICSLLLAFALVFAVACSKDEEVNLEEIYASVFEDVELLKVTENLTLPTEVEGVTITWTSSNPEVISNEGVVTRQATDVIVTLTAVLTVEGQDPITKETKVKVLAAEPDATKVWAPITGAPEAGKVYKFGLWQSTTQKTLYLNGEMDGYYFATTENVAEAIDVEAVAVEGGYNLKATVAGATKYIEVVTSSDGAHVNVVYSDTPTVVFTWNAELLTFTTSATKNGEAGTYYMGNYSSYVTFSASEMSHATDAGTNLGHLYTEYNAGDVTYPPTGGNTDGGNTDGGNTDGGNTDGNENNPTEGEKIELNITSLGLTADSYTAGTKTVGSGSFEWVQLGNYGDGIQMRDKDDKTSILWNNVAFGYNIEKIILTFSSTKSTYDNANAVIFSFGNSASDLTSSVKLSTAADTKTYTITPDGGYAFFKMEHDLGYTFYWESIVIVLSTTASNPVDGGNTDGGNTDGGNTDGDDTKTVSTIAEVKAGTVGSTFTAKGTVIALYAQGFLVKDSTDTILVFKGSSWTADVAVGDTVTVTGATAEYSGAVQFGDASTYTKDSSGAEVTHGTPTALDGAAVDAYKTVTSVVNEYVTLTGSLAQNGKYYELSVEGATLIVNLQYPSQDLSALLEHNVTVNGYVLSASDAKLNIMIVEISDLGADPDVPDYLSKVNITGSLGDYTYIAAATETASFYSSGSGGLKMNKTGMGVLSNTFVAQTSINVTFNVGALNQKTTAGSDTATTEAFIVYGLDANGEVVDSEILDAVVVGDNTVTLTGEGIVQVKIVMNAFPYDGTAQCNVNLSSVEVIATPAE